MKKRIFSNKTVLKYAACLLIFSILCVHTVLSQNAPHLKKEGNRTQLIVNGEPFLSLAGELHNSSSSSLEYMEKLWPTLRQLNLNTVLAPVSWELVEPEEGQFDFALVDGLIAQARKNDMKLIFLWFGSWKNLVSTYAPAWVKNNPKRFPLFYNKDNEKYQMLSSFAVEAQKADARAFAALMKHIKQADAAQQTVIMMQVENEVGTDFGERDHSTLADKAYNGQVPAQLMTYLQKQKKALKPELKQLWADNGYKTTGTWPEVFGNGQLCNEIFMAWHLALYIGEVIKAGKAEYDIPMFVNASVGRQSLKPATYPSGGPVPFVMDVWYAAAPGLDMLCPDIYRGDFDYICREYTFGGTPLYIPEATRAGDMGAINAIKAFCNHGAMGFSPFGIERYYDNAQVAESFSQMYGVLNELTPLILKKTPRQEMIALVADTAKKEYSATIGKYKIDYSTRWKEQGYAIVINTAPDEFLVVGKNINVHFSLANRTKNQVTGILSAEEGRYEAGRWKAERRMNGDEIMLDYGFSSQYKKGKSGNGLAFGGLSMQWVKLYAY